MRQIHVLAKQNPPYSRGKYDCSGTVYLAAKWAGILGVQRTTSANMAKGLNGWQSKEVPIAEALSPDLMFWTFKPDRVDGHVGVVIAPGVAHASEKRGFGIYPLRGEMITDISRVRRLTIGDPEK